MGDLVVGARSGSGEPERRGSSSGAAPEGPSGDPAHPGGPAPAEPGSPTHGGAPPQDAPPHDDLPHDDLPHGDLAPGEPAPGDPAHEGPAHAGQGPDDGTQSGDGTAQDGDASQAGSGQRSFWKELPILVVIALVLALVIKTFFVQAFSIPSASMQNTLQKGDRVLVDKLTPWFGSKPQRGEVVVFHDPGHWLPEAPVSKPNVVQKALSFIGLMPSAEEKDLIKRVIAVGGDTVSCTGGGKVKVNGKSLDEPYIYPGAAPCADYPFKEVKVPKGRIWVMGDHRNDSMDSRYHQNLPGGGTVSDKQVVGRAFTVAWPVNRWAILHVPGTFAQPGLAGAAGAVPASLGLLGALPLVVLNRRRLLRKSAR